MKRAGQKTVLTLYICYFSGLFFGRCLQFGTVRQAGASDCSLTKYGGVGEETAGLHNVHG